jgi:hypothetical protein
MIKWLRKNFVFVAVCPFANIFKATPPGFAGFAWFEIGEYDEQAGDYQFEGQAPLYVAPDGSVWARICDSVTELPAVAEG